MVERSFRGLFWSLVLLGALVDQVSKYTVFRWLYHGGEGGQQEVIPGAFELRAEFAHAPDSVAIASSSSTANSVQAGARFASLRALGGIRQPRVNHGALFGFLGEYTTAANGAFALVSVLAALAIAYWSTRQSTARDPYLCAALGLILAGTLGNLYDRIVFEGVRDFLHFYLVEWPVFNFADCCLVCGAFLLLGQAFWARPATADLGRLTLAPEAVEAR
jgi:signal peptidase II